MNSDRYILVGGLLAAALVLCLYFPPFYAFIIIPAFALAAMLISSPRAVFWVYLVAVILQPFLYLNIHHPFVKQSNKVVGVALFAVLFGQVVFRRISFKKLGVFPRFAVAILAYALFAWMLNRGPLRALSQSILYYFAFIPLFVVGRDVLKKKDFGLFLKAGLVILWISFALNMGWRFGINPLFNQALMVTHFRLDAFMGIFPSCNFYAYFLCLLFIFLIAVLAQPDLGISKRMRGVIYISLPALLFDLVFTNTNHSYAILLFSLVPFVILSGFWKKWQMLFLGAFFSLAVLVAVSTSEMLQTVFTKEYIENRVERLAYSAKFQLYDKVFKQNLSDHPMEWVFGVGPGNGVGMIGKDNLTDYALRMLLEFYARDSSLQYNEAQMTSISGLTDAGYITLWGDFGLFGTPIYLAMYGWLLFYCLSLLRKKDQEPYRQVIATFLIGAIVYIALLNILIDTFGRPEWAAIIWGLAALLLIDKQDSKVATECLEGEHVR